MTFIYHPLYGVEEWPGLLPGEPASCQCGDLLATPYLEDTLLCPLPWARNADGEWEHAR